jgi:outer membrane protein
MKQVALIAILCLAGATEVLAQKFGHLDAQEILLTLPERADAQAQIEATAAEYEGELARMQSELETKFGEYQTKAATWPDAIRQQKEVELQRLPGAARVWNDGAKRLGPNGATLVGAHD